MSVTAEEVRWTYRLLLGREPESEAIVEFNLQHADRATLVEMFLSSTEFLKRDQRTRGLAIGRYLAATKDRIDLSASEDQIGAMLDRISRAWNAFGETEPHWSVLTSERFLARNIAGTLADFYKSGETNIDFVVASLLRNGIDTSTIRQVADFGCGVGRLTFALAKHFDHVVGIDVSQFHIDHATHYAATHAIGNARFIKINALADLDDVSGIDLVVSLIVLQHNPPPIIVEAIKKLLHALNAGGCAYFQVPNFIDDYSFDTNDYLSGASPQMEMNAVPQKDVFKTIRDCGCDVLEVREDGWTGSPTILSHTFLVQKRAKP